MNLFDRLGDAYRRMTEPSETRPIMPPIVDQEITVTQDSLFLRYPINQYSPDQLIQNKKFDMFEQMYLDDQVHMAMTALKLIRLSSGYKVIEASKDPRDIEIADFVADTLEGVQGSLHDVLFNMMGALEMGWSLHEIVHTFYKTGPWAGKLGIKAIKSKNPKWFNVAVDDFYNPTGIVSISAPTFGKTYPIDKFVVYSFQKRYENIFGTSRLRALYQWWWLKQVMIRALGVHMERFGSPAVVAFYPPTMQSQKQRDDLTAAVKSLRFQGCIVAPDGVKIDLKETKNRGAEGYLETIEKADRQIAKVILGQTLTSDNGSKSSGSKGGGGGGSSGSSGALGQMQFDILLMYLDYIGMDIAQKPMATLIKNLVDFNYDGVVKYPTFQFNKISQEDLVPSVEAFMRAAQAGIVNPRPEDEERIREILQFPTTMAKQKLRPSRYVNKPTPIIVKTPSKVDPKNMPTAAARGASPSGPGAPSNFAEGKLFTGVKRRSFTPFEEKVDFSDMLQTLEKDGVRKLAPAAGKVLRQAVDKLLDEVRRSDILKNGSVEKINKLQLRYKGDLNAVFRDGLQSVARDGMKAAKRELRGKAKRNAEVFEDLQNLEPAEVLDFIKNKAFWMTDVTSSDVLDLVKVGLFNGVKMGKDYKDIVDDVEHALAPYFGEVDDVSTLTGALLETTVRTNISEAYNEAKKSIYTDPALDGFVLAMQYSAILDDRVRDAHAAMDGRVYTMESPIWDIWTPPNGFNCRCTLVPVVEGEEFEESEDPPSSVQPDKGFK